MNAWPWRLFKKVATYGATYAVLQVVTGVEVGIVAVAFYYFAGMGLPSALSAAFPIGLPLLLLQGAVAVAYHEGLLARMLRPRERALPDAAAARAA